jgi:hypothetical protein
MSRTIYKKLQKVAQGAAVALPQPAFYEQHGPLIREVDNRLLADELIRRCRTYLDASKLECAHGICHCETVARDAGALILIEAPSRGIKDTDALDLSLIGVLAGLLHDIKRAEKDHAVRGSIEAERILLELGIQRKERSYITEAIKNHEAFKTPTSATDTAGQLVSDALYDADKFRWGPENFSSTLWIMVAAHNTPVEALHLTFKEQMRIIGTVRDTFRTATGRHYGPEIIDQGILIGNAIYAEMSLMLQTGK